MSTPAYHALAAAQDAVELARYYHDGLTRDTTLALEQIDAAIRDLTTARLSLSQPERVRS